MKSKLFFLLVIFFATGAVSDLFGWGYWAHLRINRAAVFTLPEEMRRFFYNHIDFITEEAVIPDVRKYAINDKAESNRHYVDLEMLPGSPSDTIPHTMKEATAKYTDSLLQKAGLLPWYIDEITTKLTKAFRDRNKSEILFLSGDLAHYLADACMPLHTTINHDGQLSGQKGIHSFWESRLPETFGSAYNLHTGDALFMAEPKKEIWRIIQNSHTLVDTVLLTEKALRSSFPADQVFEKDAAGNIIKNKYNQSKHSFAYSSKFHLMLNGMVEKQMRLAIAATGNFWYTSWVNAGKPDLTSLDPDALTNRNKKYYNRDYKLWVKGRLFGLKSVNEF